MRCGKEHPPLERRNVSWLDLVVPRLSTPTHAHHVLTSLTLGIAKKFRLLFSWCDWYTACTLLLWPNWWDEKLSCLFHLSDHGTACCAAFQSPMRVFVSKYSEDKMLEIVWHRCCFSVLHWVIRSIRTKVSLVTGMKIINRIVSEEATIYQPFRVLPSCPILLPVFSGLM